MTREIEVAAGKEQRELNLGRLPENVVAGSIYAEGSETIEVRGVRVSQQASTDSDRVDVRELTASLTRLAESRERATRHLQVLNKKLEYIDQLMDFSAQATQSDLGRGVLNAPTLTELSNFSMDKQTELNDRQLELEFQLAALVEEEAQVKRELDLRTQAVKPFHEAKLQISARNGQAGSVALSYLVTDCGWKPQYTVRGTTGQAEFGVRYSALVQQMSGEDWSNVHLTLSTASSSLSASGPALTPLRVTVASSTDAAIKHTFSNSDSSALTLQQRIRNTELQLTASDSEPNKLSRDFELNNLANEMQNTELQADSDQLRTLAADATDEVSSQVYDIEQSVSLPSRREQHLVQIFNAKLPGNLYHVATPLLSSFAYREVDMVNNRNEGLLKGAATIYLDDRFIGRTEIPSIASGQHLVVGFGADQQVRTQRELLDKSDEIQGGNRRLTFKYRLVIANFKSEPVQLRLYDRLPFAGQSVDVSVRLSQPAYPISTDGLYERVQKPRGILRWELGVPGERFGEKAFDVEYSYSAEFDRSQVLTALLSQAQLESDYLELSTPSSSGMGGMGGGMPGGRGN